MSSDMRSVPDLKIVHNFSNNTVGLVYCRQRKEPIKKKHHYRFLLPASLPNVYFRIESLLEICDEWRRLNLILMFIVQ